MEPENESAPFVRFLTASLPEAKEIYEACQAAEIAVEMARDACCGKGGCGCAPKVQILAAPSDLPRIGALLQDRWQAMLAAEGLEGLEDPELAPMAEGGCPACGVELPETALAECPSCGLGFGS